MADGWWFTSTPSEMGAIGDVLLQTSYVDFSDPTVLATYINPDGTWKYVAKGSLNYSVGPGGAPEDLLINTDTNANAYHFIYGHDPSTGNLYPADLSFDECGAVPIIKNQPRIVIYW